MQRHSREVSDQGCTRVPRSLSIKSQWGLSSGETLFWKDHSVWGGTIPTPRSAGVSKVSQENVFIHEKTEGKGCQGAGRKGGFEGQSLRRRLGPEPSPSSGCVREAQAQGPGVWRGQKPGREPG